jgi:hypothetical protein
MKKLTMALFFISVYLLITNSAGAGDIQDGFQGIKWEQSIMLLKDFTKLYSKNDVHYYANPDKVFQVGEVTVTDVVYGFYLGKFFAVYIKIDGLEAFGEIKNYMKSRYGLPKSSFSVKNRESVDKWKKKDVKIKLKHSEKTGKMKLAFYYTPLSTEINEAQQEQLHDSKVRWFPIERDKKPSSFPLLTF